MTYQSPTEYWGVSPEVAGTLPLGLRHSNNLFNIKYFRGAERNQQKWPGLIGPSEARDQGDPQMKFSTVEDSGVAGAHLLRRKYDAGMRTPNEIIAGKMGWTGGRYDSAKAVADYAGVRPNEDLRLNTPEGMRQFLPALATQEHGQWARKKLFNENMFDRIAERATGAQFASGELPKLDLLKEDGSNAARVWSDGTRGIASAPPVATRSESPAIERASSSSPSSLPSDPLVKGFNFDGFSKKALDAAIKETEPQAVQPFNAMAGIAPKRNLFQAQQFQPTRVF
jgi:hypothetical protein